MAAVRVSTVPRMDIRREKLYLTLKITVIGMVIALVWHGWQGWIMGNGYPYNSFLFIASARFTDLTDPIKATLMPSPYLSRFSEYFPATYGTLKLFSHVDPLVISYLFVISMSAGLGAVLMYALQPVISKWWKRLICTISLLGSSYPFLFCLDRANLEITLVLMVSISLLYFQKRRWYPGLACLFPAICAKFYPILLLALFVRRGHLVKPIIVGVAFLVVSVCFMASFSYTLSENWQLWHRNFAFFREYYVIGNGGFAGSASPWNTLKALLVSIYYVLHPDYDADLAYIPLDILNAAYSTYVFLALGTVLTVVLHTILVEREFFRRAVLLLLISAMTAPNGSDYKLLFANVALMVLVLVPTKRPLDLLAVGLLAFAMIPKREILLTYLGRTDSGAHDIPVSILLNPPCMLIAMGLLISDGFQRQTWKYSRRRFLGIVKLPIWRLFYGDNFKKYLHKTIMGKPS